MSIDIQWRLAGSHVYWWQETPNRSSAPRQVAGDYTGNIVIDWPHTYVPNKGDHIVHGEYVLGVEEILWTPGGGVLVFLAGDRRWRS